MNLTLSSTPGSNLSALQWTFSYPATTVASVTVSPGSASSAAGKSISCAAAAAGYTCIAYGMNTKVIANGVVAIVNVGLAHNATTGSINIVNLLGASLAGGAVPVTAGGGILTVLSQPAITSLSCSSASLAPSASSACTVGLSAPAGAGGAVIALTSDSANLNVPPSVAVPSGNMRASFNISAKAFTSDATATITATMNGGLAKALVSLALPSVPTSLQCAAASLAPGSGTFCSVTISKPAPAGGLLIHLFSNNSAVTVPVSAAIPANATSASFAALDASFSSPQVATVSASLDGVSVSTSLALAPKAMSLRSLQCTPTTLNPKLASVCEVVVSNPSGLVMVQVSSDNVALLVPSTTVVLPTRAALANFMVLGGSFTTNQTANLTATLNGSFKTVSLALVGTGSPASLGPLRTAVGTRRTGASSLSDAALVCGPGVLHAGESSVCELRFASPGASSNMELLASTDNSHLLFPASIAVRSGQRQVRFEVAASAESGDERAVIAVRLGNDAVESAVTLAPSDAPLLGVPGVQAGWPGSAVHFVIRPIGSNSASTGLIASGLPAGATFDASTGVFDWVPTSRDPGAYRLTFTATGSRGFSASRTVPLTIVSGPPLLDRLQNAAGPFGAAGCVTGSAAGLTGVFPAADQPGESRVFVNGESAAVVAASPSHIEFICPAVAAGTDLAITVQTPAGISQPLHTVMRDAAPGILTVGSPEGNQALAFVGSSRRLAAIPSFEFAGEPTMAGDALSVLVTGVVCTSEALSRQAVLQFGASAVPVDSIAPSAEHPGVCRISATVPGGVAGDHVPLSLSLIGGDGVPIASNSAFVAVAQ